MHNNRVYHQVDYARMAQTYGWYGEGPIADPKDLAPAIGRALDRVKRGEPAHAVCRCG
jgi:hypothetical protein